MSRVYRRGVNPHPFEHEARRRLVPSRTTLLGLLKHVTFVERVWFDEGVRAVARAPRSGSPRTLTSPSP